MPMKTVPGFAFIWLIVAISLLPQTIISYSPNYYQIRDLETNDNVLFPQEAAAWTASSYYGTQIKYSVCAGTYIVGGYKILGGADGQYFERKYQNLQDHVSIAFSINLWVIDSWDSEHVTLSFDGSTLSGPDIDHDWYDNGSFNDLCGYPGVWGIGTYKDLGAVTLMGVIPHSLNSLTFRIISRLDDDTEDESFGIRNVNFMFLKSTPTPSTIICANAAITLSNSCPCNKGFYKPSGSSCTACHSYCDSCYGPSASQCYACKSPYIWDGTQCVACHSNCNNCFGSANTQCLACKSNKYVYNSTTCLDSCPYPLKTESNYQCGLYCNSNEYLYWDNSCSTQCNSPLQKSSAIAYPMTNSVLICIYKCSLDQFLYWDESCQSSCTYPLSKSVSKSRNLCAFPCDSSQYLYWNQNCSLTCDFPLSQRNEYDRKFCDFPCPPTYYLYWNQACASSCPAPLTNKTEGSASFCEFPCEIDQYLYWNESCVNTCEFPLKNRTINDRYLCDYPCSESQFLYWNGSCLADCPPPYITNIEGEKNFCESPCSGSDFLYWDGTCLETCDFPLASRTQSQKSYCEYPCGLTNFLYWNGSCEAHCDFPLINETISDRQFCQYPCTQDQFLNWNGSCVELCPSPYISRVEAEKKYCDHPCTDSDYLYWNEICLPNCNTPLIQRTEYQKNFCDFPCDSTQILYWNGNCSNDCKHPLSNRTENDRNFCEFPCNPEEYLYWNQDCNSSCPSPLTSRTEASRYYCDYLCTKDQYLYWNESCQSNCDFPLLNKSVSGRQICEYPCHQEQFLYWNGSCFDACPIPFTFREEAGQNYCDHPCTSSEFLYWDDTCLDFCNFPLVITTQNKKSFCEFPCSSSEFLYWNGTCSTSCDMPLAQRDQSNKHFCDFTCDTEDYLYWNQACDPDCPYPLKSRVEASRNYCDHPCASDQYLYWDESCDAKCDFPLKNRTINDRYLCEYPCIEGQFLGWNGSCLDTCSLPYVSRVEAERSYCDYPCEESEYLFWDDKCVALCDFPFVTRVEHGKNFCDFPCNPVDFLYWDGTCSEECPSPLDQIFEGSEVPKKFCKHNCTSQSDFLYWNGTCADVCESPLVPRIMKEKLFCDRPCLDGYLYSDSSCLPTCPLPLVSTIRENVTYCEYMCNLDQYLYWNGSCMSSCGTLFDTREDKGYNFCDYPCDPADYLWWNKSCLSECPSPFSERVETSIVTRLFCDHNCKSNQFVSWNGSCLDDCNPPLKPNVTLLGRVCSHPCNTMTDYYYPDLQICKPDCEAPRTIDQGAIYLQCRLETRLDSSEEGGALFNAFLIASNQEGTYTIVKVIKVMKYLRFLNIVFPPRLERLAASNGKSIIAPHSASRILQDSLSVSSLLNGPLPSVFGRNELDSSFIVNFKGTLIFLLATIVVAILLTIAERFAKKKQWQLTEAICMRLRVIFRWNLAIMLLATNIDEIILYSSVEFKTVNSPALPDPNYFSVFLCVVFIVLMVGLMIGSFVLIKRYQRLKVMVHPNESKAENFETKWQDFQVIFKGYRDNKTLNQFFFLIYMVRLGLPMFITVCALSAPVLVTIVQVVTSALIVGYLIRMKPFKKRINQIQLLIYEIIIAIMNIFTFILTLLYVTETDGKESSIILGDLIIIGNDIINILAIGFLISRCVFEVIAIRKYINKQPEKSLVEKTRYIQLLAIWFQQANMGFEELNDEYPTEMIQNCKYVDKKGTQHLEGDASYRKSLVTATLEGIKNSSQVSFLKVDASEVHHEDNSSIDIGGDTFRRQPLESIIITNRVEESKMHGSAFDIEVDDLNVSNPYNHQKPEGAHQPDNKTPVFMKNIAFEFGDVQENSLPIEASHYENHTVLALDEHGLPPIEGGVAELIQLQITSPILPQLSTRPSPSKSEQIKNARSALQKWNDSKRSSTSKASLQRNEEAQLSPDLDPNGLLMSELAGSVSVKNLEQSQDQIQVIELKPSTTKNKHKKNPYFSTQKRASLTELKMPPPKDIRSTSPYNKPSSPKKSKATGKKNNH